MTWYSRQRLRESRGPPAKQNIYFESLKSKNLKNHSSAPPPTLSKLLDQADFQARVWGKRIENQQKKVPAMFLGRIWTAYGRLKIRLDSRKSFSAAAPPLRSSGRQIRFLHVRCSSWQNAADYSCVLVVVRALFLFWELDPSQQWISSRYRSRGALNREE